MPSDRQRFLILVLPLAAAILYSVSVIGPSSNNLRLFLGMADFYAMPVFITWVCTGLLVLPLYLLREAGRPHRRTLRRYFADTARIAANPANQITWLTPPIIFIMLMSAFGLFKQSAIPGTGYWADPLLANIEHHLLGGRDAWEITHALFSPLGTLVIDRAYQFWFVLMTGSMLVCSYLSGDPLHRCRFMLCFIAVWIINGSFLAYLMPAAGPIYFSIFHIGADPFLLLKTKLAADDQAVQTAFGTSLFALKGHALLLEMMQTSRMIPGGGISAMPSMHNAVAILAACAGFSVHRAMGWLLAAFAALIFVGSVHLGWHYALDGMIAGLVSYGLWVNSGAMLRRYERRQEERRAHRPGGRRTTDLHGSLA